MAATAERSGPRPARALSPALVLAGLLLVAGNLRAAITTIGPVLAEVRADLGLSAVTASALISLPLICFAVVSPVAPVAARRFGLERTLGAGLVVLAVGVVLRSLPGRPLLWAGTALLGIAVAVLNVVLPALVKRDFPTRIGQVTGAYSAVQSSFAAAAAGAAVPVAGLTAAGWRLPMGMWAGLAVIALGVLAPQLRRHTLPPTSPAAAPTSPAAVPASPGAALTSSGAAPASAGDMPGSKAVATGAPGGRNPWRTALGWQITAYMALQSTGYYVLITWLPSIENAAGISEGAAGVHLLLLNACAIGGSLACSTLIPRFRDQRLLGALVPAVFTAAAAGLLVAPGYAALWACLAGLGGGANIVLALSFFGLRTSNHHQAAALSGMAQSVGYLIAAAGPVAVGALHDATGTWTPALVVVVVLDVLLIGFGYLSGRPRLIDQRPDRRTP